MMESSLLIVVSAGRVIGAVLDSAMSGLAENCEVAPRQRRWDSAPAPRHANAPRTSAAARPRSAWEGLARETERLCAVGSGPRVAEASSRPHSR